MNNEKHDQLIAKYPDLFRGDCQHMEIDEGWYPIVDRLMFLIQARQKHTNTIDPIVIEQIKEKFGGLRFYYSGGDKYIAGLVDMAETICDITCETCGKPGQRRGGGWIKTLCDEHAGDRSLLK